jgi:tripartite tricarboxylate transporter TctB family protein
MTESPKALGADLVIPVVAFAFTVYFLYSTSALQWEARSNGLIIGTLLLVLVVVQFVRVGMDFARRRGTFTFGPLVTPGEVFRKRIGMLAITIAFVAALPWVGLAIGLFVALAASFALMGVRPIRHVLLVAFAITVVCWLGFTVALDMGLPPGPVEKLFAHFTR